jgi:hypothetical protein
MIIRSCRLLLPLVLLVGLAGLPPRAAAQKADPILVKWGAAELATAPDSVRNGDPVTKAKYAMTRYCAVLQNHKTQVNSGYWNRLQQLARSGDAGRWTCGDHANNLSSILRGMGIKKTIYCVAWWSSIPSPNSNHGALAVIHKGQAYLYDPWQLATRRGGYVGADATMWNGMPADKWEREMRKQGYHKFGKTTDQLKPTLKAALQEDLTKDLGPYVVSGRWKFYSGGQIGSPTENKAFYTGTLVVDAKPYEAARATLSFGSPETMKAVQTTEKTIVFTRALGQVVQRYRGFIKDHRRMSGTFSHLGPKEHVEHRWWAERL